MCGRGMLLLWIPLALVLGGIGSCRPRLVSPAGGFLIVDNVLSNVRIRTSNLQGAGRIDALLPDGTWSLIHLEPDGSFVYSDRLPFEVWHCSDPGASEGCVARLQVSHDRGGVGPSSSFGKGIVHVCTRNYVQRHGRRHCGARALEHVGEGSFSWAGDAWERLVVGSHAFRYIDADSPPGGALAEEVAGVLHERRWNPKRDPASIEMGASSHGPWQAYGLDIGACSFFVPWEWEHRLPDAYYTAGLGNAFGDRGLAELFLDEMIDTTEPVSQHEVNALLWIDGVVGIVPNQNASPEFHYRLSEESGEPQICFKQYYHANSDISAKPDHWYRFDQAIGAFFLQLLPFIGDCGWKNVAIRYCGTPRVDRGAGTFEVDSASVHVAHQGYPRFRAICNNQFVPSLVGGITSTFAPGGEGATAIDAGVATLVDGLSSALGLTVRRIEMSPRGMYLVTAENTRDPQYGLGDCREDLDRGPVLPSASRPSETGIEVRTRGVTRF